MNQNTKAKRKLEEKTKGPNFFHGKTLHYGLLPQARKPNEQAQVSAQIPMKSNSQNACILKLLKAGCSITPGKAWEMLGCTRLAARIHDIRNQGHMIAQTMVESGGKRFARYKLAK
jgi:hypothetical protein